MTGTSAHRVSRTLLVAVGALLALAVTAVPARAGQPATPPEDADVAALKQLVQQQADAWAKGDGAAFAATFTRNGDLVTYDGTHLHGRKEIASNMQRWFDRYTEGTRLITVEPSIRFPTPDTAVMVSEGGCVLWPGEEQCSQDARSVSTRVALRQQGEWLFTAQQVTRIRNLLPEG